MLTEYEKRYKRSKRTSRFLKDPIMNKDDHLKGIDLSQYTLIELEKKESPALVKYKPSDLFKHGEYPFSNFEDNQLVIALAFEYFFFNSKDPKLIY